METKERVESSIVKDWKKEISDKETANFFCIDFTSEDNVKQIVEALSTNFALKEIRIGMSPIGDMGGKIFAEFLKENHTWR